MVSCFYLDSVYLSAFVSLDINFTVCTTRVVRICFAAFNKDQTMEMNNAVPLFCPLLDPNMFRFLNGTCKKSAN